MSRLELVERERAYFTDLVGQYCAHYPALEEMSALQVLSIAEVGRLSHFESTDETAVAIGALRR